MDPQSFLQQYAHQIAGAALVLVFLYVALSSVVRIARAALDPPDGTRLDGVLDLGEGFLAYSAKVALGLSKIFGRYVPEVRDAAEVIHDLQPVRVDVAVTVQSSAPYIPPALQTPDDVPEAERTTLVPAVSSIEPPAPEPPRGAQ